MFMHWNLFIKPALDCIDLSHIVEIGAHTGLNTKKIIMYCHQRNARLTSIDCVASEEVLALSNEHKDCFTLIEKTSLEALPELSGYEAILIDGDHNWYTVYNELKAIEKTFNKTQDFPLVFFHDTAWPYSRRDMYYSPDNIPEDFRHPYSMRGIVPEQSELDEHQVWLNYFHNNATTEGTPRNGVLTAIEDFINDSKHKFYLALFNGYNGIGMLATDALMSKHPKLKQLFDRVDWAASIGLSMEEQFKEIVKKNAQYQQLLELYNTLQRAREKELSAFLTSTSWKITRPLRKIMKFIKS